MKYPTIKNEQYFNFTFMVAGTTGREGGADEKEGLKTGAKSVK